MQANAIAERLGLKTSTPKDPTSPLREYGIGAQILRELGVRKMIYLSDTQPTRVAGLDGYGMTIEGWRRLNEETN
jgi:3,4-dihydroxy 2-butanone 4-phosphate synthase/GTP cyclohydrolase II